jgi:FkbM family methyltransferase
VGYKRLLKRTPLGPVLRDVHRRYAMLATRTTVDGFDARIPRRDLPRYRDEFEPLTTAWMSQTVREGMTAVDVGAAVGLFSLTLARLVGSTGRVVAIEPAERNIQLLKKNVRRNGLQVEVVCAAASCDNGVRDFFLTDSSDSHAFFRHPLIAPKSVVKVRTVRLDSLMSELDFLKVDVEGAELDVLAGAGSLLADHPPLIIEWAPACQLAAGRTVHQLPDWLALAGYHFEVFDELNHRTTTVKEVLSMHAAGSLPRHWYANLCCRAATTSSESSAP